MWSGHEAPDEFERRLSNVPPARVDGQRMAAALDLAVLRGALVDELLLIARVRDPRRRLVVLAAREDQQRTPVRRLLVGLELGTRVHVRERGLEHRHAGARDVELLV